MSRRLHRELQLEGREAARQRDDDSYPVFLAKFSYDPIGWIDTEGNFTTSRSKARARATRLDWLGKGSRQYRKAQVKVMLYARAYGYNPGSILP